MKLFTQASPAVTVAVTTSGGWGIVLEAYLQWILVNDGCSELYRDEEAWWMCEAFHGGG
jgi:hypothetical protein